MLLVPLEHCGLQVATGTLYSLGTIKKHCETTSGDKDEVALTTLGPNHSSLPQSRHRCKASIFFTAYF